MVWAVLALALCSVVVAFVATTVLVRVGMRAGALDGEGVSGQVKVASRRVPNVGGIGIVAGLLLPLLAASGAAASGLLPETLLSKELATGIRSEWTPALVIALGLLTVHVLGLIDDRTPLHWAPKLLVMVAVPVAIAWFTDTRVFTAADGIVGGSWLSITLTAMWFAAVMNAINFMDNMDGLAGGTACVIAIAISAVAWQQEQWLVAGAAACLFGATLGFLPLNFPKARIFMGDGGSLVLGYCLAFLTTRLTYVNSETTEPRWDRMIIPLVLLAVPLYDMLSVIVIRLRQGR
ncbi:MAG: MraY family glycosyltransferase, partial [Planctomycetota bacterium]